MSLILLSISVAILMMLWVRQEDVWMLSISIHTTCRKYFQEYMLIITTVILVFISHKEVIYLNNALELFSYGNETCSLSKEDLSVWNKLITLWLDEYMWSEAHAISFHKWSKKQIKNPWHREFSEMQPIVIVWSSL